MPNNQQKKYATRSTSKSSKKQTNKKNDEVVDKEPVRKIQRERLPPCINRNPYYQKKISDFFKKYLEEKQKMAEDLPHLYTWTTGIVMESDKEFSNPDPDNVLYIASDHEFSDDSDYEGEEYHVSDQDEVSVSKESVAASKDTKNIVSTSTLSSKRKILSMKKQELTVQKANIWRKSLLLSMTGSMMKGRQCLVKVESSN